MSKPIKPLLLRITNALSLVAFFGLISTGLILKFVLPPGSGRIERLYGRQGGGRPIMTWLGESRHEWGDWHFYISIAFLALLIIHIMLNWNWIRATARGTRQCPQPWLRKSMTIMIVFLILLSLFIPFMIKTRVVF